MDYSLTLDEDRQIVVARVTGVINWENAPAFSKETRETASQHGYSILFDLRQTTMEADIYEIYRYPRETEYLKDPTLKSIITAVLVSFGKDEINWEFYQEAAQSAGIPTRVFFDDEEAAIEWLVRKGPDRME